MTLSTHTHQQPPRSKDAKADSAARAEAERGKQAGDPARHPAEESARSVMHPDHHDPDWRYYFGAVVG